MVLNVLLLFFCLQLLLFEFSLTTVVEEGLHVSKLEKKQWIILLGTEMEPKRQL